MQKSQNEDNAIVKSQKMSLAKKRKMAIYALLGVLAMAFILPMAGYTVHFLGSDAYAQGAEGVTNPRANYWRAVEGGVAGYSAVQGPETGVLIGSGGVDWQQFRNGFVAKYLPWGIVGMLALLALYHLIHGRNNLEERVSGKKIKRWGWFDRLVHWMTAISFIALAITGLSMLIGRALLIPLLGKAGFASWAQASIVIHNVLGPVFAVGILLMIVMWVRHNVPNATDLQWFKQGGGLFSQTHPSAGRMNGGEKVWFWLVTFIGLAVCFTGVVMLAPVWGYGIPQWLGFLPWVEGSRLDMQEANVVHAVLSLVWTAVALGHIYIGTAGTEGALEGMSTGYVSTEWARQHHDQWYEEMVAEGKVIEPDEKSASAEARKVSTAT